jgi:hypothetical protein
MAGCILGSRRGMDFQEGSIGEGPGLGVSHCCQGLCHLLLPLHHISLPSQPVYALQQLGLLQTGVKSLQWAGRITHVLPPAQKENQWRVGLCVGELLCCLQHYVVVAFFAAPLQRCHVLLCCAMCHELQ